MMSRCTKPLLSSLLLSLLVLTGCAQGGLMGSGLYKANMFRGLPTRQGMTPAEVQAVMGPSWDTVSAYRGEVWRYGYNAFGMLGPSCRSGGRGGDIGCVSVIFVDGTVVDVVRY